MDTGIAVILAQDGIVNGAIYGLLGLAIVLVFSVTRIIFVPQGEFVAFGTLTMAMLQAGHVPGTLWLLLAATAWLLASGAGDVFARRVSGVTFLKGSLKTLLPGACALFLVYGLAAHRSDLALQVLTTLVLVVPLGPLLYRAVYAPLASSSVLVLLIVSVAVHLALEGLGLLSFGAEGFRLQPLFKDNLSVGFLQLSGAAISVLVVAIIAMTVLVVVFGTTIFGKALRATASNATGARIVGIRPDRAGSLAFGIAAFVGAISGLLIGPITTIYYDSGFLIALKGFVAAIIGGLHSYPMTALGAIFVGLSESFSAFYASAFKDAIVFALILPVLFLRSLRAPHREEG